jgi:hypothetical protein
VLTITAADSPHRRASPSILRLWLFFSLAAGVAASIVDIYSFLHGNGAHDFTGAAIISAFAILTTAAYFAAGHARVPDRTLDRAHRRARALDRAIKRAYSRARSHDPFSNHNRDLNPRRARAIERALDSAFTTDPDHTWDADCDHRLGEIKLTLDSIRKTVRAIAALPVDASGANLSRVGISDLDILDGVIWTLQTTWPPGIAEKVRRQSDEIMPGTYQVHTGETHDRNGLTRV